MAMGFCFAKSPGGALPLPYNACSTNWNLKREAKHLSYILWARVTLLTYKAKKRNKLGQIWTLHFSLWAVKYKKCNYAN